MLNLSPEALASKLLFKAINPMVWMNPKMALSSFLPMNTQTAMIRMANKLNGSGLPGKVITAMLAHKASQNLKGKIPGWRLLSANLRSDPLTHLAVLVAQSRNGAFTRNAFDAFVSSKGFAPNDSLFRSVKDRAEALAEMGVFSRHQTARGGVMFTANRSVPWVHRQPKITNAFESEPIVREVTDRFGFWSPETFKLWAEAVSASEKDARDLMKRFPDHDSLTNQLRNQGVVIDNPTVGLELVEPTQTHPVTISANGDLDSLRQAFPSVVACLERDGYLRNDNMLQTYLRPRPLKGIKAVRPYARAGERSNYPTKGLYAAHKRVDLRTFFGSQGVQMGSPNRGGFTHLPGNKGFYIKDHGFVQHGASRKGNAVDAVMAYYDISFPEAIHKLEPFVAQDLGSVPVISPPDPPIRTPLSVPAPSDFGPAKDYLTGRGIDPDIVDRLHQQGHLSGTSKQVLFLGRDPENNIRHVSVRDHSGGSDKRNLTGSDHRFTFSYQRGNRPVLYVAESPIDLMSLESLTGNDGHYLSLDGLKDKPLQEYLAQHPEITNVCWAVDHDDAGLEAMGRIAGRLPDVKHHEMTPPPGYDWNEVCQNPPDLSRELHRTAQALTNANHPNIQFDIEGIQTDALLSRLVTPLMHLDTPDQPFIASPDIQWISGERPPKLTPTHKAFLDQLALFGVADQAVWHRVVDHAKLEAAVHDLAKDVAPNHALSKAQIQGEIARTRSLGLLVRSGLVRSRTLEIKGRRGFFKKRFYELTQKGARFCRANGIDAPSVGFSKKPSELRHDLLAVHTFNQERTKAFLEGRQIKAVYSDAHYRSQSASQMEHLRRRMAAASGFSKDDQIKLGRLKNQSVLTDEEKHELARLKSLSVNRYSVNDEKRFLKLDPMKERGILGPEESREWSALKQKRDQILAKDPTVLDEYRNASRVIYPDMTIVYQEPPAEPGQPMPVPRTEHYEIDSGRYSAAEIGRKLEGSMGQNWTWATPGGLNTKHGQAIQRAIIKHGSVGRVMAI